LSVIGATVGVALAGFGVGAVSTFDLPAISSVLPAPTHSGRFRSCQAIDGDTLRCGGERVRLLAIDAPELPGHCRPGRDCAPGDPFASTTSLSAALSDELRIERVGEDHYGRTLASVSGPKGDLSCWQLEHGQARYRAEWDSELRVARTCPAKAL
jgi:endonuclease YncB( thermonuclease family)